jgi:glycosyltransferase involved in cell wall biosynthesis
MNILLINHYAGSPYHGMEYRPFYMAREWVRAGHAVTVVAASQAHVRTAQPATKTAVHEEVIEGITYMWFRTPMYSGNGIGRVRNMLSFVVRLLVNSSELSSKLRPDVVIASSTYPLDIYPARKIAKLAQAKLIFEVHDLWPLTPIELGRMSRWHPFIVVMQKAENDAYRNADKVVSMLPNTLEHMIEHGMVEEKFVHIPNGVVSDEWVEKSEQLPDDHEAMIAQRRGTGRLLVGYAGAHGVANALDSLVEAAGVVGAEAEIILIGKGPEKPRLKNLAQGKGIKNVTFLDPVSKHAIPALLSRMDVLFIGWNRQPLYRFGVSPNKLMDYMMAGKPVIHAIEAANDPVAESGCGLSVEPESAAGIAGAISKLARMSPEERESLGSRGRTFVLANHEYRVLADRFIQAMA